MYLLTINLLLPYPMRHATSIFIPVVWLVFTSPAPQVVQSVVGQALVQEAARESDFKGAFVIDTASVSAASRRLGEPALNARSIVALFPGREVRLTASLDENTRSALTTLSAIFISVPAAVGKELGTSFQVRVAVGLDGNGRSGGSLGYYEVDKKEGAWKLLHLRSKQY